LTLSTLPRRPGDWGLGAMAGLAGEVLLYDGRLLVSRGVDEHGRVSALTNADEAALFVSARVTEWVDVPVPSAMDARQFEAFVLEQARSRGLDGTVPFPFLVKGRFDVLEWHVLNGSAGSHGQRSHGGHGAAARGAMKRFEQPGASGQLVGFYTAASLEGIASHPGERFHVHYVDDALRASGHVDRYGVGAGAVVSLPVR
jgi:alpha-acetolactate decarboxylase